MRKQKLSLRKGIHLSYDNNRSFNKLVCWGRVGVARVHATITCCDVCALLEMFEKEEGAGLSIYKTMTPINKHLDRVGDCFSVNTIRSTWYVLGMREWKI